MTELQRVMVTDRMHDLQAEAARERLARLARSNGSTEAGASGLGRELAAHVANAARALVALVGSIRPSAAPREAGCAETAW